jgi:hypothetical protein
VLRLFQRRGLLTEATVENMLTWQASGGFSLDASVRIHGSDAAGRERLVRCCARPPFALERLRIERHREGAKERTGAATHGDSGVHRVIYYPARPTRDGRTVLALSPLSPLEFLAALSRLIPPPRVHRHRCHGVLAPNARLREHVINLGRDGAADMRSLTCSEPHDAGTARDAAAADLPDSAQRAAARSRWARLLARIYEVPSPGTGRLILHRFSTHPPRIVAADLRQLHLSGGRQKCIGISFELPILSTERRRRGSTGVPL